MNVNELVGKAVEKLNQTAQQNVESKVANLVHLIIQAEKDIANLKSSIERHKKELKDLELPNPVELKL